MTPQTLLAAVVRAAVRTHDEERTAAEFPDLVGDPPGPYEGEHHFTVPCIGDLGLRRYHAGTTSVPRRSPCCPSCSPCSPIPAWTAAGAGASCTSRGCAWRRGLVALRDVLSPPQAETLF